MYPERLTIKWRMIGVVGFSTGSGATDSDCQQLMGVAQSRLMRVVPCALESRARETDSCRLPSSFPDNFALVFSGWLGVHNTSYKTATNSVFSLIVEIPCPARPSSFACNLQWGPNPSFTRSLKITGVSHTKRRSSHILNGAPTSSK